MYPLPSPSGELELVEAHLNLPILEHYQNWRQVPLENDDFSRQPIFSANLKNCDRNLNQKGAEIGIILRKRKRRNGLKI